MIKLFDYWQNKFEFLEFLVMMMKEFETPRLIEVNFKMPIINFN